MGTTQDRRGENNLYGQPYAYYLDFYRNTSPQDITQRTKVPYYDSTGAFRLPFLGTLYQVEHPSFSVHHLDDTKGVFPLEESPAAKILVLRFLLEGDTEWPSGSLLAYQDLPWGDSYLRQFRGRCIQRLARMYGNRKGVFCRVMESLGAVPMGMGDVSYQIEILEHLSLCLILWEGDEEYPPSAQILFSDNFPVAFSAEDAAYVGDVVLDYLMACERKLLEKEGALCGKSTM